MTTVGTDAHPDARPDHWPDVPSGLRLVSLVPSATETLRAWGVTPVACTRFCEQPDLPTVGGTKNPDIAAISALAPGLVVLDEEENRREDHDALVEAGIEVVVLAIRSVEDVDVQLTRLASAVGASWTPLALPSVPAFERRAVVPIWRRPWMALGTPTYGASLLAHLGIQVVPHDAGSYPELGLDAMAALAPDLVVVPSEPYDFDDGHLDELRSVAPAVVRVDGQDLFWWGARTSAATARLTAQLSTAPR